MKSTEIKYESLIKAYMNVICQQADNAAAAPLETAGGLLDRVLAVFMKYTPVSQQEIDKQTAAKILEELKGVCQIVVFKDCKQEEEYFDQHAPVPGREDGGRINMEDYLDVFPRYLGVDFLGVVLQDFSVELDDYPTGWNYRSDSPTYTTCQTGEYSDIKCTMISFSDDPGSIVFAVIGDDANTLFQQIYSKAMSKMQLEYFGRMLDGLQQELIQAHNDCY